MLQQAPLNKRLANAGEGAEQVGTESLFESIEIDMSQSYTHVVDLAKEVEPPDDGIRR